jgi:hypothetical protein
VKDGHLNDELHLAEMVSLMGPPPKEFLARSEKSRQYWDEEGTFATLLPNVADTSPFPVFLTNLSWD